MEEVLRSNDLVHLGWAEAVLAEVGIASVRADEHMSVLDGSIGALPRRLLVAEADLPRARRALAEAEASLTDGA